MAVNPPPRYREPPRRDPETGPVMNAAEVSAYLRIHRSTVYRLIKTGKLPCFRIGSDYRFNREEIDRWRLSR